MPKALIIFAEGFEEIEAATPVDLLRRAHVDVTTAGLAAQTVKSARGLIFQADTTLEKVTGSFDALVLPGGGGGAQNLGASKKVQELILDWNRQGKWICAICASPALVLAPSGILNHKSCTGYPGTEQHFHSSTTVKNQAVVVDQNIITSQGPATAIAFALTIIEKLCGKAAGETIKADLLA